MEYTLEKLVKTGDYALTNAALVCSNFEQAAEKQKRENMSKLFGLLARSFLIQAMAREKARGKAPSDEKLLSSMQEAIEQDLKQSYTGGERVVKEAGHRGALRALTWGSKVSAIQKSVLKRYLKLGDELLKEGQAVHVCQACGFVGIGDAPPGICPVCKAPSSRFVTITRRRN